MGLYKLIPFFFAPFFSGCQETGHRLELSLSAPLLTLLQHHLVTLHPTSDIPGKTIKTPPKPHHCSLFSNS